MDFFDRKRPVHIHPIGRDNIPIILFLTVCSKDKQKKFNNSIFHDAVRKAWIKADAWKTGYYMIMPDHVHWFCTPGRFPIYNLKQWIKYWKRVVTINYEKQLEGRCPQRPINRQKSEVRCQWMEGRCPQRPISSQRSSGNRYPVLANSL